MTKFGKKISIKLDLFLPVRPAASLSGAYTALKPKKFADPCCTGYVLLSPVTICFIFCPCMAANLQVAWRVSTVIFRNISLSGENTVITIGC